MTKSESEDRLDKGPANAKVLQFHGTKRKSAVRIISKVIWIQTSLILPLLSLFGPSHASQSHCHIWVQKARTK